MKEEEESKARPMLFIVPADDMTSVCNSPKV